MRRTMVQVTTSWPFSNPERPPNAFITMVDPSRIVLTLLDEDVRYHCPAWKAAPMKKQPGIDWEILSWSNLWYPVAVCSLRPPENSSHSLALKPGGPLNVRIIWRFWLYGARVWRSHVIWSAELWWTNGSSAPSAQTGVQLLDAAQGLKSLKPASRTSGRLLAQFPPG